MQDVNELIDAVTAKTKGTKGDPLTREEVELVVRATLAELIAGGTVSLQSDEVHGE